MRNIAVRNLMRGLASKPCYIVRAAHSSVNSQVIYIIYRLQNIKDNAAITAALALWSQEHMISIEFLLTRSARCQNVLWFKFI